MNIFLYVEQMEKDEALKIIQDYQNFKLTGLVKDGSPLANALEKSGIHKNFWIINTHALLAEIAAKFIKGD